MDCITKVCQFDYEVFRTYLYSLKRRYPFLNCRVCGRSLAGRAIFSVSIGSAASPALMAGGFHGQEWLTPLLLLRFLERICESMVNGKELCGINVSGALQNRELLLVPNVNPDSNSIALHGAACAGSYNETVQKISGGDFSSWNANARGVDINHNFDAGWEELRKMEIEAGITGPAPRRFGGTMPESEPETSALTRLCRIRRPRHALAIHSQGEEIFWQYGENTPEKSRAMAEIFSAASGYTLVDNEGLASHGGFKDWFIDEMHCPGFTIEIGKGKNPLPMEDFEGIYSKTEKMLTLAAIM